MRRLLFRIRHKNKKPGNFGKFQFNAIEEILQFIISFVISAHVNNSKKFHKISRKLAVITSADIIIKGHDGQLMVEIKEAEDPTFLIKNSISK